MRRSALKINGDNSYGLLATKLYKKQRNYVVILRKNTFRNICQMVYLQRISGSFVNHSLKNHEL